MSYVSNNAVYEFSDSIGPGSGTPMRRNDRWTVPSNYGLGISKRKVGKKNPNIRSTTRGSKMKKSARRPR